MEIMDRLPAVLQNIVRDYLMVSKKTMMRRLSRITMDINQYSIVAEHYARTNKYHTIIDVVDTVNLCKTLLIRY